MATARFARNGQVRLAFEAFGPPGGHPLLLIQGLDSPMQWWPDGFCAALAARGFAVVRYDLRDCGRSSRARPSARPGVPAYTAMDMIDDAAAVLDALGWSAAHVVGMSLGASVAVGLALRRPERVRSVVSLMGLPAGFHTRDVLPHLDLLGLARLGRLSTRQAADYAQDVAVQVSTARMLAARSQPFDEEWARRTAVRVRAAAPGDPATARRQLAALRADDGLLRHPESVSVPLLALAGAEDPLIRPQAARVLARSVPQGRALVLEGVGHEVPRRAWPLVTQEIERNAGRNLAGRHSLCGTWIP
ncbi:alpha/beta hydrolase [Actinospica durhamensis]|uniref:Alpha/beta hydrolase n=1 Tax=Actinospica durhamensis TaxID=1508375 RepID=A0A941EYK1_9ACTN|nr:alpha/beta hydrolase [Actinospica durhamensis]MBR7838762.1 alpha/beta hydrolase [Actinospica durhamensis]